MSHGERQDWAGTMAVVAAPPPKSGTGAAAALRTALSAEATSHQAASQWELLCRGVTSAQKADLLALANQQGLLYSYQLPPPASARGPHQADVPFTWNLLGGQVDQLEPVRSKPIRVADEALDETQRHAVASALATGDVCLIVGQSGTGKSRVVAEILGQAAQRGDRALLVAGDPASLDHVLEQLGQQTNLCPIRCVAADEQCAQLPPAIQALTLQHRAAAVRDNAARTAKDTRQAAEMQCARRRHQEPLWPRLEELAAALVAAREALAELETKMAAVEPEVAAQAQAASGRLADDVRTLRRKGEEHLTELAGKSAAAQTDLAQQAGKLGELDRQIALVEPLAAAKTQGHWWAPGWWKATLQGDVCGRLAQLQTERQTIQTAHDGAAKCLQELKAAREAAAVKTATDLQARLQAETDSRRQKLSATRDRQNAEVERHQTLWTDLCRQIDPDTLRPAAQTQTAVAAARELWQQHRQDDEARCAFAREWAEFLESSSESVVGRLPGYANLVAATPLALAADPHFGDAAAADGQFDLLVVEAADHLTESEFLKLARRARQWVLLGEPPPAPDPVHANPSRLGAAQSAGAGRGHWFHQLWARLHCDPSTLPYQWFREGQRLGCRLRLVAPNQRQWLESEPLADAPDVELRILALPRERPVLAEVLFSGGTTMPAAKEFLFRELQEIPVQTDGSSLRWSETPQTTILHLTETPENAFAVTLDAGIREFLAGPDLDHTCKLEFDRSAGWDRVAVQGWLEQHLGLRDLGRSVRLEKQYRMPPALSVWVVDVLSLGRRGPMAAVVDQPEPSVEFVAVVGSGKPKGANRNESRGPRKAVPAGSLPAKGAGLEFDLSAVRPGDRLPNELRGLAGRRGFVNLQEARAVVRELEDMLPKTAHANGCAALSPKSLVVMALYSCQAELIRQLIQRSPQLATHLPTIAVCSPVALRQREADVVLVSLTRSHSHLAVAYGEEPAALELALTRARHKLVLVGDPGNLVRRSQWRGALDHLDEAAAHREMQLTGQMVRYLQGQGRQQQAFRFKEGCLP